jgi:methylmalonyl-CoA mutase N-terminal domain/subunit
VLGGCQSLHTNSLDEALALPTEHAALVALRTQQIIAHETGVTNTIDPVAGSYAIERLTNEIEAGAQTYIDKIHAMGGPLDGTLRAIESGFIQGEIQKAAYEFQRAVESNEQIVVGVNDFKVEEERPITILRVEEQIARDQIERLKAFRLKRDATRVKTVLGELARRAAGTENLVPAILDTVENNATVGEISDTLRRVFGEYRESVVI